MSTEKDPSILIESFAILNIVMFPQNETDIVFTVQTYKELTIMVIEIESSPIFRMYMSRHVTYDQQVSRYSLANFTIKC